jgi:hypothetical protein
MGGGKSKPTAGGNASAATRPTAALAGLEKEYDRAREISMGMRKWGKTGLGGI